MSPCRHSRIALAGAAAFLALVARGPAWDQPADNSKADDSKPASSNVMNAHYPRLHPDLRATFRLKADGAQKVQDVIPMIDRAYRTIADREHRAMAGLSMGGNQFESPAPAHEWQTWRRDLNDFAPRLFR